jgi:hypothetical protein
MLGLGLGFGRAACGGAESTDAVNSTFQAFTVVGVDKASVSFTNSGAAKRASQDTVRVARDSTGAPSLQADQLPLGPVYQFTPLDLFNEGIEIRIPLSAQAAEHGKPVLHVAALEGEWQAVPNARRDGEFIVAKVPSLSYATLATASSAAAGERVSRLAASASPSAPVITSSSGSKTVLVGQTATFTVAGTGNPKPTVTWQRRHVTPINSAVSTTTSFPIAEEQDWVDIDVGCAKNFYTTGVNTLANSGDEYRAVLTNSQGVATSLPASLRVLPQVTAPAITTAPVSQTVQAGQSAVFTVAVSGTSPLSYQWFKNAAVVVGANSTSLAIPVSDAEVGSVFQITVQISNSAGSVTSPAATLTVVAAPPTAGGTLITAAEGGEVVGGSTGEEASLYVAPGALSANTTILLTTEPLAPSSLPAGITAMSDIEEIKPAGLSFLKPASLTIQMKQNVPANNALAVLKLDASNTVLSEIRRTALSYKPVRATAQASGRMTANAFNLPPNLSCLDQHFVDSGRNFTLSAIGAAVRTVLVAAPQSMCASIGVPADSPVPLDTMEACGRDSQFGRMYSQTTPPGLTNDEISTVNRHVNCRTGEPAQNTIYVDLYRNEDNTGTRIAPATASPNSTFSQTVGTARFEFQATVFGSSNALRKTLRYRVRTISFEENPGYAGPQKRPDVYLRPRAGTEPYSFCYATATSSFPAPVTWSCGFGTSAEAKVSMSGGWSDWVETQIRFDWTIKMDPNEPSTLVDLAFYSLTPDNFDARIEGADPSYQRPGASEPEFVYAGLGGLPILRCDRGLAKVKSEGCVFADAAPVYVLERADPQVREAADHIFEAQSNPDADRRSPGKFLLKLGTRAYVNVDGGEYLGLKRFKNSDDYGKPNNLAACSRDRTTSLIKIPPVRSSSTCSPNQAGCECDEFPFNATWQGTAFDPNRTSVK